MNSRTAIVVGGSRGIGLATAEALVNSGWNVVVTARDLDCLQLALSRVSDVSRTLGVAGRAEDPDHQATTAGNAVELFGSIDALVHCVGSSRHVGPILDTGDRDAIRMFETNVLAPLAWVRSCEPHLRRSRGAVVTVASLSGLQPTHDFGMYAVTKAALLHLTRQLAMELAPAIRVNTIAPALVDTDFAKPIVRTAGRGPASSYPLGRIGTAQDVAAAAAYLVNSESAWMTGQTLVVDGGISTPRLGRPRIERDGLTVPDGPSLPAAVEPDLQALFDPIQIGRLRLANRIALLPQGTGFAHEGEPTWRDVRYYAERARGGTGVVIFGGMIAHPSSQSRARYQIEAYDRRVVPALAKRCQAVQQHGVPVIGQLLCLGREIGAQTISGAAVGPSAIRSPRFVHPPRALERAEITELVQSFARSARHLVQAGHDGIEIHAAHGYLIGQFLSPLTNQRSDRYGGNADRRSTFLIDVLRAVRSACPEVAAVGVRVSVDEEVDGGLGVQDAVALAALLEQSGLVDYLSCTVGVRGGYVKDMSHPRGVAVERIARIRSASSLPVIAAGRISQPSEAAAIIRSGQADLIGLSRALIADPDWPRKAASGTVDEIRPCVAESQECRQQQIGGLRCMVNPTAGREGRRDITIQRRPLRRVLVVGGGPGGLEAAAAAAACGDAVTLVEAQPRLGGQLLLAARPDSRAELRGLITYYERELRRLNVDVHLGVKANEEDVAAIDPDLLVIAVGGCPVDPVSQLGLDVPTVWDVLAGTNGPFDPRTPLAVVDDGTGFWHAVTAAEVLASEGYDVSIVTGAPGVALAVPPESLLPLYRRLSQQGVRLRPNTAIRISDEGGFELVDGHSSQLVGVKFGTVVAHAGVESRSHEHLRRAIRSDASSVVVGDARAPRLITHAILEGRVSASQR